jgi:hypothetical protein
MTALGVEPESILATNAIFARSKDEASLQGADSNLGSWDWWRKCLPVHQAFLRDVQPMWIIAMGKGWGTSAFSFLMDEAHVKASQVKSVGGDDRTGGRLFEGRLTLGDGNMLDVHVLGVPHPSRVTIGAGLADFIRREVAPSGMGA